MKCKYCGEEFSNKGMLLSHYKKCTKKHEESTPKCCKVITEQPPVVEVNSNEAYVLVKLEDYIPYDCVNAELAERDKRIRELETELEKQKNIDSVSDGELYWPLSLLPEEYSLLADGQFVSLRVSGRIKGDKVLVQDVKV